MRGRSSQVAGLRAWVLLAVLCVVANFSPPIRAQIGGLKSAATQEPASGPTFAELWQRLFRPTNSQAAATRGEKQFGKKKFEEAAKSFDIADHLAPDAKSAFNLGTAQIAAGRHTEGSATLGRALRNALLRPDALYNRGNAALASKAYEYAIRDYTDTLKLRPADMDAKRNLELALRRLEEMQRSASAGGSNQQQQQQSDKQQKSPSAGRQQQQPSQQGDTEALLRSVQQQEQEELERMKRARAANVRIGW